MEKNEAIWLAAAIDFEGSIGIYIQNGRNEREPPIFRPYIGFTITHKSIADLCLQITNVGWVGTREKKEKRYHDIWTWRCSSRKAVSVLNEIYPYLKIKREQAKLAFEIQKLYGHDLGHSRWHPAPQHVIDERIRLYQLCKDINRRVIEDSGLPAPELI